MMHDVMKLHQTAPRRSSGEGRSLPVDRGHANSEAENTEDGAHHEVEHGEEDESRETRDVPPNFEIHAPQAPSCLDSVSYIPDIEKGKRDTEERRSAGEPVECADA